ncbi:unnamed protein product [Mesocestoides corti]|uniref:Golgi SNAP receptor complex member 1 n=1 Tax=Mesocestoides corti TaxID=53468 RepID=A0A0R3UIS7_MESCO|nr:unnamed protein product [Mesocestoides corti]
MQWGELRRQARTIESELDVKLTALSKVGSSFIGGSVNAHHSQTSQSSINSDYGDLCKDIEDLLQQLTQVNDKMSDVVSSIDQGNISQQHTAKRHREILFDYMQDFRRMRANYTSARNREELLTSTHRIQNAGTSDKPPDATRLLLEEQQSLLHTDKMLLDRLAAASAIRSALRSQHHILKTTTGNLLNLRARFPIVNKVLSHISWRKKRDTVIIGSVIGCCFLFLLIYLFH